MYKKQSLGQSFLNAVNGLIFAIREERNMRVALTFIPPVLAYGFFAGLSRVEFAIIIICLSIVCLSEIINSSIENTIDSVVQDYHPLAGKAKDMGAAVTLSAAVMSAVVGLIVLYKPDKLLSLLTMLQNPWFVLPVLAYIALALLFIIKY